MSKRIESEPASCSWGGVTQAIGGKGVRKFVDTDGEDQVDNV